MIHPSMMKTSVICAGVIMGGGWVISNGGASRGSLACLGGLAFEVLVQVHWLQVRLGAAGRNLQLRRPQDSVHDQLAHSFIGKVAVGMATGHAERTNPIAALVEPGRDVLAARGEIGRAPV